MSYPKLRIILLLLFTIFCLKLSNSYPTEKENKQNKYSRITTKGPNDLTEITIKRLIFSNKCNHMDRMNYTYRIEYERAGEYTGEISQFKMRLSLKGKEEEYFFIAYCQSESSISKKSPITLLLQNVQYLTCKTTYDIDVEGSYYGIINEIETEDYKINAYTNTSELVDFRRILVPMEKKYKGIGDYSLSETGTISLLFNEKVSTYRPILKFDNGVTIPSTDCIEDEKNNKVLKCNFTEEDFPSYQKGKNYSTLYTGKLINTCGEEEGDLEIETYTSTHLSIIGIKNPNICSAMESGLQINLDFMKIGEYNEEAEISENENIFLHELNDETNNIPLKCSYKPYDFHCITMKEPSMKGKTYYVIDIPNEFFSNNYLVGKYTKKTDTIIYKEHYVKPVKESIVLDHDYKKGDGLLKIQFNKFLQDSDDFNPKVYVNGKKLTCQNDKMFLKCSFTDKLLPYDKQHPEQKVSYTGYILNLCNLQEPTTIQINVNFTVQYAVLNVTKIVGIQCDEYKKNASYILNYDVVSGKYEGPFNLKGVEFINVDYPDIKIPLLCEYQENNFICYTQNEKLEIDGNYKMRMANNYSEDHFTILPFESSKNFIFPNIPNEQDVIISYDYSYGDKGQISFGYLFPVKLNIPYLNLNGKIDYPYTINGKTISFSFNSKDLPYDVNKKITYDGNVNNFCGNHDTFVRVITYKTQKSKTVVKIEGANLHQTCEKYNKNFMFKLKFSKNNEYYGTFEISNVLLVNSEDNNTVIEAQCTHTFGFNSFDCNTVNDKLVKNGTYSVLMKDDIVTEKYEIEHFLLKDVISFSSENVNYLESPTTSPFVINHNYKKQGNQVKFNFVYQMKIENFIPVVTIDNKNVKCTVQNYILQCSFTNKEFPTKKDMSVTTYEGYLTNICGGKDLTITVHVSN